MGIEADAKCRKCGKSLRIRTGGGFRFHLLRCSKCGRTKSVGFGRLGDLHARYLKGMAVPYALALRGEDKAVRAACQQSPLSQRAYHAGVESIAGACGCGGLYKLKARPRCPKCRSTSLDVGDIRRFYD